MLGDGWPESVGDQMESRPDRSATLASRSVESGKLHAIQVLRFVAAAAVVVSHAIVSAPGTVEARGPLHADFFGAAGVSIFFIISGFIMVRSTRTSFASPGAVIAFLRKRVIRIVPIYWVTTLVALSLLLLGSGGRGGCNRADPSYIAASFLFMAWQRCDGEMQPLLTQGWTLNYEAFFYVAFGFTLLLRRAWGILILCLAFAMLVGVGFLSEPGSSALAKIQAFYTQPLLLFFILGVLIALARERLRITLALPGGINMLLTITAAALLIIDITFPYSADPDQSHLLVWIVAPATMLVFVLVGDTHGRARSATIFEALGDASYSIYLTHVFALSLVRKAWEVFSLPPSQIGFAIVGVSVALATGYTVFRLIELPLVQGLRGRADKLPFRSSSAERTG